MALCTGKQHEECTVCGAKRSENTEIPALRAADINNKGEAFICF